VLRFEGRFGLNLIEKSLLGCPGLQINNKSTTPASSEPQKKYQIAYLTTVKQSTSLDYADDASSFEVELVYRASPNGPEALGTFLEAPSRLGPSFEHNNAYRYGNQ